MKMARASNEYRNASTQEDVDKELGKSLLRPLHELKREELVVVCQNLEKCLRNRDRQIDDINKHCEDLMTLYYDTMETLAMRNRELHLFQDQVKHYEELSRCQEQLKGRQQPDESAKQLTPGDDRSTDYDSASISSENTDPELACLPNDDEDGNDVGQSDDEYSDDGDELEETPAASDADVGRDVDQLRPQPAASSSLQLTSGDPPPPPLEGRPLQPPKQIESDMTTANAKLYQSLKLDSLGKPAQYGEHRMPSKLPVPNAAARARRHSKHLARSCQDLGEKVHPVLHRRDPNKSLYDVMMAETAGVVGAERHRIGSDRNNSDESKVTRTTECPQSAATACRARTETKTSNEESAQLDSGSEPQSQEEQQRKQANDADERNDAVRDVDDKGVRDVDDKGVRDVDDKGTGVADRSATDSSRNQDGAGPQIADGLRCITSTGPASHPDPSAGSGSTEIGSVRPAPRGAAAELSLDRFQTRPSSQPGPMLSRSEASDYDNHRHPYRPTPSNEPIYSKTKPVPSPRGASAVSMPAARTAVGLGTVFNPLDHFGLGKNCKGSALQLKVSIEKDSLESAMSNK